MFVLVNVFIVIYLRLREKFKRHVSHITQPVYSPLVIIYCLSNDNRTGPTLSRT